MSDRREGRDDSFDVGESFVEVRKAPKGRGVGRIVAAAAPVALGCLLIPVGFLLSFLLMGLGFALWGLGFAIYDYRWPFGPRPGTRGSSGRRASRREAPGSDDY